MMGTAFQLLLFALVLYGIGDWGVKNEHWSFRVFVFGFAMPAGFFMGWAVMQVMFPYFSIFEQMAITGSISGVLALIAVVVLRYTRVQ
ncbi:MAG: hypothetical protein WHV44_10645 [Anaerolineales bacterium]